MTASRRLFRWPSAPRAGQFYTREGGVLSSQVGALVQRELARGPICPVDVPGDLTRVRIARLRMSRAWSSGSVRNEDGLVAGLRVGLAVIRRALMSAEAADCACDEGTSMYPD